jgi:hypothetical protein
MIFVHSSYCSYCFLVTFTAMPQWIHILLLYVRLSRPYGVAAVMSYGSESRLMTQVVKRNYGLLLTGARGVFYRSGGLRK